MADESAITQIGYQSVPGSKQAVEDHAQGGQKAIATDAAVAQSAENRAGKVENAGAREGRSRKALSKLTAEEAAAQAASAKLLAGVIATTTDKQVENLQKRDRFLAASARAYDPVGTSIRKLESDISRLNGVIVSGGLNEGQAVQAKNALAGATRKLAETQTVAASALIPTTSNLGRVIAATEKHTHVTQASTAASRQMQFALTNLSFQVNDVVSSLGAGISPMQTFFQQGGQIFQIGQQVGPRSLLTGVKEGLSALITPFNLAIAGAATLAVGLGVVIAKAVKIQGHTRQAGVTLRGMGTSGLVSAEGLEKSVRELREVGIAADDAREAVQKVVRTPGLNPAQTTSLVTAGANLGAIRGSGIAAGTDEIVNALQGGPEALIKLGTELRKLAPEEVAEIRRQNDIAGSVVASDTAYRLLSGRIGGSYKDNLSQAATAWNDLKNAYTDFITSAAGGSAIKSILDDLAKIPEGIKRDIKDIERIIALVQSGLAAIGGIIPSVTSAGDRATQSATAARNDMTDALAQRDRDAGGTGLVRGAERFDTSKISGNTEALQQLTTVLGEASKSLPEGYSLTATSGLRHGTGGSLHDTGNAIDVQIVDPSGRSLPNKGPIGSDPGLYKDLAVAAYEANRRLYPDKSLTWGGRFETSAGSGMADWMHFDRGADRGRFGPPLATLASTTTSASAADATRSVPAATASVFAPVDQTEKLDKQTREYGKVNDAARKFADSQVYAEARIRGLAEAESLGIKGTAALTFADNAARQAVEQRNIERGKASIVQDQETSAVLKTAAAFKVSAAEGYRVQAQEQARIEVMQRGGDVANRTRQILEDQAASALRAGAEQSAAAQPQLAALDKLAEATLKGTDAARDQNLQNEAVLRTQDALAKAEATRNPGLIAQAKALQDVALAEGVRADASRRSIAAAEAANDNRLTLQRTQLETGLTSSGATSEEIQRQVAYLTVAQDLATKYAGASDDARKAYADTAIAIADANVELQKTQREQERWNDLVRGLANTIDNELTKSIENAFSGDKVESWGKRIQKWLGTATSSLSSSMFIKPALGSLAGALGFGTVAQGLGSLGSLDSLLGTGTSSSGSGGVSVIKGSDGSLTIKGLDSTTSLTNSLFGNSSGGIFGNLFGGSSTAANSTASNDNIFGTLSGAGSSSVFNNTDSLLGTLSGSSSVGSIGSSLSSTGSSFFSSSTLSSVGAGFGAGSLTNSLLGGNQLGGSIGSGIGSLAGTAIGGPIGGLIGGAIGGAVGGMFGNEKPANAETGFSLDLASGKYSDYRSSGNKENDRDAKEIRSSLSDFTKSIQSISGGTLSGYVNPQVGTRGTKLDYNIPGYGSGTYTAADAQDAIDTAELAISRGLTGIGITMKTVIDQVTDPADLDAAIKFAKTYEKLADAAKDSFSSIPSDLNVEGPFKKAKDDIKDTFDAIADDASTFGLDMAPVTAALDEANKRLTKDFNRYVGDLTKAIDDPLQSAVDIAKRSGDQLVRDAEATGGDVVATNRYNAKVLDGIWKDQTTSLKDLADELRTGALSGLTATQRLKGANDNYRSILADVQSGKTAEFGDLVTAAKNVFSLSTDAYGQGPKTAGLRTDILGAIDGVLASRSFASGGVTRPGWNQVGEQGPEWLYLPTPATVLPHGQMPSGGRDSGETAALLRELLAEMRANTGTARQGHLETGRKLDQQTTKMDNKPLYEPTRRQVKAA